MTPRPSKYEFLMKNTTKKTRKEDSIRLRVLNGLLYKSLTELLSTPEVSQEVYDLNVELSKVSKWRPGLGLRTAVRFIKIVWDPPSS